MDLSMILKILIMACGVYMAYWAVQMKTTNKIPVMLVGKNFPIERAKNPEGFIKFTFPFTLGTGVILFAAGLVGALEVLILYPILDALVSLMIVIAVIFYGVILMKAQRKYLVGLKS